ncbi:winged helix-turn-helix transcriptional regulator [Pannonibacter tanglangensis]|uniref:Transcriptional regulator n=1 Tax=Pannonibacter tanglangensis TaxID=2750084 RepID=A0ABW9ZD48_9HYPH|nr:helix-turn-helix domain-containing protein [Pannonibacter sp. XCT-34]NBN62591.1 transcriptional regulator [Pannonibacter sp. XCT-34]
MVLKVRKNRTPHPPGNCPLSHCMAILGGAWTPNIIWYLSSGPRRFSELRGDIPPISAKVLTDRLRQLEAQGIVSRAVVPSSPPSVEYALTDLGAELIPAIEAIADVSKKLRMRQPGYDPAACAAESGRPVRGRARRSADASGRAPRPQPAPDTPTMPDTPTVPEPLTA